MSDLILEALKTTAQILAKPEHWCKGSSAKDVGGFSCDADSPDAHSFCILGALSRANPGPGIFDSKPYLYLLGALFRFMETSNSAVAEFNDSPSTTFEDVSKFLAFATDQREKELAAKDEQAEG